MPFAKPKIVLALGMAALSASLTGCMSYQPAPRAFNQATIQPYTLDSGDRLRVTVFDQAPPPGTRWYRVKVKGGKRHSAPVAVTVGACPLPLDRSPGVVSATRCTSPVG